MSGRRRQRQERVGPCLPRAPIARLAAFHACSGRPWLGCSDCSAEKTHLPKAESDARKCCVTAAARRGRCPSEGEQGRGNGCRGTWPRCFQGRQLFYWALPDLSCARERCSPRCKSLQGYCHSANYTQLLGATAAPPVQTVFPVVACLRALCSAEGPKQRG